jgi:preprotein translocase subunit SecE
MPKRKDMYYTLFVVNILLAAISCLHHSIFSVVINLLFAAGFFVLARHTTD